MTQCGRRLCFTPEKFSSIRPVDVPWGRIFLAVHDARPASDEMNTLPYRGQAASNPHDCDTNLMRMTTRKRVARLPQDAEPVTLVVYGWSSVEPGTLSWTFPSLRAALDAAHAMKNATQWAVVAGARTNVDVDDARTAGDVLMETLPTDWLKIG